MLYRGIFPCHYKIGGEDVHKIFKWPPHVHVYGDIDIGLDKGLNGHGKKKKLASGHAMYKFEHG